MDYRNYYDLLEIGTSANAEEIRSAFRRMAQQYHPDVCKKPNAEDFFSKIVKAYDVLSDPSLKADYDAQHGFIDAKDIRKRKLGIDERIDKSAEFLKKMRTQVDEGNVEQASASGVGLTGKHSAQVADQQEEPQQDKRGFLKKMFTKNIKEGSTITVDMPVSFLESITGAKKYLDFMLGNETKRLNVPVPAGVVDGAVLKMRTTTADLALVNIDVKIMVEQNGFMQRAGLDLIVKVPITIGEALLGSEIMAPTADGSTTKIKTPAFWFNGKHLRIRGRGFRSPEGKVGDTRVVADIIAPGQMTPEIQQIAYAIARSHVLNVREEYNTKCLR